MCDASFLLPAELNDFREWKWKDPTERGGEGERERERERGHTNKYA